MANSPYEKRGVCGLGGFFAVFRMTNNFEIPPKP